MPRNTGHNGGRKPLQAELQQKAWHLEQWEIDTILKKLQAKIDAGVYSVRDMFLYMALKGDKVLLAKFVDKVLPNLMGGTGEGGEFLVKWLEE